MRLARDHRHQPIIWLLATLDDGASEGVAPPCGGASGSSPGLSKVAKSRCVTLGAGSARRACNHRPRRTLAGTDGSGRETEALLPAGFSPRGDT